ncbi:MAG: hypothetical protein HQL63_09180 [Magnetococcales bacterium]|nr:hypothetical protein [Magnetococcales bacterium]
MHSALILTVLLAAGMSIAPAPVRANPVLYPPIDGRSSTQRAEDMIIDGLICRPLGLAASVLGVAIYTVTLPFSLAGGNSTQAAHELVVKPFRFTFTRPLGGPECRDGP